MTGPQSHRSGGPSARSPRRSDPRNGTGSPTWRVEELEAERDFLLGSLRDLDTEFEAGDIDLGDYETLKADYTTRAAATIRTLAATEGESFPTAGDGSTAPTRSGGPDRHGSDDLADQKAGGSGRSPERGGGGRDSSTWMRRLAVIGSVAVVAALAGVLVAQSSGRRGSAGPTGLDVSSAASRIDDCQAMEAEGDPDSALGCYSEILETLPGNVPALTFRGWLQVREFDLDDGLDDLDAALQLNPRATAPYVFRASARSRDGDAAGAVADLARFYANGPAEQERALADQFSPTIVEAALDACIEGDVDGSMNAVAVLECYRNVLDVDPGNATASVYLGWLLARGGMSDDAMALLDDGIESDPSLSAGYVFRAALRAHLGDVDGARADLATFDGLDAPQDQVMAADTVRDAIESGRDPLA